MTDNEIIKASECCTSDGCTCKECPYEDTKHIINEEFEIMPNGKTYDEWSCDEWLKIDLLDLINRQKAEIERLMKQLAGITESRDRWRRIAEEFDNIIRENEMESEDD